MRTSISQQTPASAVRGPEPRADGPPVDLVNDVLRDAGIGQDGRPVTAEDLECMSGGVDASTYLVRGPFGEVVVKLDGTGLHSEARALRAWSGHTTRIPKVLASGILPGTEDNPSPYLVLQAMHDKSGGVVETGAKFLASSPSRAGELGEALGAELHRLHQAIDPEGFGNFGDTPGAERTYDDWGSYLSDFLAVHDDFVTSLGVTDAQLRKAHEFIRSHRYIEDPRFLHGDVSVRNVAVYGTDPLDIGLFDPNPVSGDPSWDLAPLANQVAFAERSSSRGGTSEPISLSADLWAGVRRADAEDVAPEAMLTAQLVQAVLQAEHRHSRRRDGDAGDPEVEATEDFIVEAIVRMTR